jgi:hypothetical protein
LKAIVKLREIFLGWQIRFTAAIAENEMGEKNSEAAKVLITT